MAQKITLNELRILVKQVIKENDEYSYSEDEEKMFDDAIKSFTSGGSVDVQYDGATEFDFRPDSNTMDAIKVTVSFISSDATAIIKYKLIINTFLNSPISVALRKIKNFKLDWPYLSIEGAQLYSESKSKKFKLNKGIFPDGDHKYTLLKTLDHKTGSVLITSLQKKIKEYWENHHDDDDPYDY